VRDRTWRCDGIVRSLRAVDRGRDGVGEDACVGGGGEAVGRRDADRWRAAEARKRSADERTVGAAQALVEGMKGERASAPC